MKIVRYVRDGAECEGLLEGDIVTEFVRDPDGRIVETDLVCDLGSLHILPPCRPTKLIVVAGNYAEHCREVGMPLPTTPELHPVPASAVIAHGEDIVLPPGIGRVDYEGELVVVIGKRCRWIAPEDARSVIAGYTCGNDVSARDVQWGTPKQFARAKSVDTFAPLGPCLVTDLVTSDLALQTVVSGQVRQSSRTSDMVFPVEVLVAEASRWMTLLPGDCIFTGTPAGVGPLAPGDVCEVTVEGIGTLRNRVVAGTDSRDQECEDLHPR